MAKINVDLSFGPAMDIEFLSIEGTKVTNAITPMGSKWEISLEFEDVSPEKKIKIRLVASGIPRKECKLTAKIDGKDAKLNKPEKKYDQDGFVFYDEKAIWIES